MLTTCLDRWVAGWLASEEWKRRLSSAKVDVDVELGNKDFFAVVASTQHAAEQIGWVGQEGMGCFNELY